MQAAKYPSAKERAALRGKLWQIEQLADRAAELVEENAPAHRASQAATAARQAGEESAAAAVGVRYQVSADIREAEEAVVTAHAVPRLLELLDRAGRTPAWVAAAAGQVEVLAALAEVRSAAAASPALRRNPPSPHPLVCTGTISSACPECLWAFRLPDECPDGPTRAHCHPQVNANLNCVDRAGATVLHAAAAGGHLGVVELVLSRDVRRLTDLPDSGGR